MRMAEDFTLQWNTTKMCGSTFTVTNIILVHLRSVLGPHAGGVENKKRFVCH